MTRSVLAVALVLLLAASGCMTQVHTVGRGPTGDDTITKRQWYLLWGLVPINTIDSHTLADRAVDYRVRTQMAPTDIVIAIFTGWVTIVPRTVEVTK